ncbi:EAL domain-containing protein [Vogesella indigofera]|uniref:EAL domain-containing protein n=1 Tax=Vogesella indigofera TaxID=45465 RepID=A0ABT5I989_VOGIN|nr:EAL domain-containing protein [Vogesella indigofera]MDC7692592.1 EAL domain-containing protein [Vogesella indigofera]
MAVLLGLLPTLLPILGLFGLYVAVLAVIPGARLRWRNVALALIFTGAMLYTLAYPFAVAPGVFLDARGAILAVAILFGGPWVGGITALAGCLYRLQLGGVGAVAGVCGLMLNLLGTLWLLRYQSRPLLAAQPFPASMPLVAHPLRLGLLVGCWAGLAEALSLLLIPPWQQGWRLFVDSGLTLAGVQLLGFFVMGSLLWTYHQRQLLELALRRAELDLLLARQERDERFEVIFEQAAVGIALVAPDGSLLKVNGKLCDILGLDRAELVARTFQAVTYPEDLDADLARVAQLLAGEIDTYQLEKRYLRGDGALVWANLTVSLVRHGNGRPHYFISFIEDISERKAYQQQISTLAFQDVLTELPNRRLFLDRLRYALVRSERSALYGAILLLDLDHFKTLNDTQGHDVGDSFLQCIALRLRECVRAEDTVARLGGDEFVVILEGLAKDEAKAASRAEQLAEQIRLAVGLPFSFERKDSPRVFQTTASIGISLFHGDHAALDDLLKHADLALYDAKAAGRNTLCFYNIEMQYALEIRAVIQNALYHAQELNELLIYAQPQVDRGGRLVGAELLLRWHHPKVGWISPSQFIPLAEETGTILSIGQWVLRSACQTLARWARQPQHAALTLSINVSIRQFRHAGFVDEVRAILAETGAPPARLKLEFTESIVIDNVDDTVRKMNQLRQMGIRFSMDDFGTGYSSLSYLKKLPLDQIKIDQSFIRDMTSDADDAAIVTAILSISRSLSLQVVAEGVETEAQQQFLYDHGCELYQGFLYGRPMPLAELEQFHQHVR